MKSVAIIGGGACGLLLANLLCDDYKVTILEKNNKLGKKILASGNGKCNFTNVLDYQNKYNNDFAYNVVNCFDNVYTREFFSKLGLAYRVDEEGRAYPLSESGNTFLSVLKKRELFHD
jgi:predicted flavoprotein YhiN